MVKEEEKGRRREKRKRRKQKTMTEQYQNLTIAAEQHIIDK